MSNFFSAVVSALLQIAAFATVPLAVWYLTDRKKGISFNEYVGLFKPRLERKGWLLPVIGLMSCFVCYFGFTLLISQGNISELMAQSKEVAANAFAGRGFSVLGRMIITAFINNGFCEEMLFRGFLCKRLMQRFGDNAGIFLQAVIFALVHNVMFREIVPDVGFHITIFLIIALVSALFAILNEKILNGSIWASVIIHGMGNFVSYLLTAFA